MNFNNLVILPNGNLNFKKISYDFGFFFLKSLELYKWQSGSRRIALFFI